MSIMSSQRMSSRRYCFKFQEEDINEETCNKLFDMANERKMHDVIMCFDGEVTFTDQKQFNLFQGMKTLQKKLGLKHEPILLEGFNPLPEAFIKYKFPNGYDESKVMRKYGKKFEESYINSVVTVQKNKLKNAMIMQCDTQDLVKSGMISVDSARKVEDNKKFVEKLQKESDRNPDLESNESHTIFFQHGRYDKVQNKFVSLSEEITKVNIVSAKGNECIKQKHYWIYSDGPNCGKTYNLKKFTKIYNAEFVLDLKNWSGMPKTAQFFIFDEFGGKSRTLDFEILRALTSGHSPSVALNCKSYGESFAPREDVQIIILSNSSPYEVYGSFDNKLQRRFTDSDTANLIHERFEVYKLDGDVSNDVKKFKNVTDWSEEEFKEEIKIKRKQMITGEDKMIEIENFLIKVVTMYKMRASETGWTLAGLRKYISEPEDWNIALNMYSRRLKLIPEDKRRDFAENTVTNDVHTFYPRKNTFYLSKECYLQEIQSALYARSLLVSDLFLFMGLDLHETDFDWYSFKKACKESFSLIDEDELLNLVITFFLRIKKRNKISDAKCDNLNREKVNKENRSIKRKREMEMSVYDLKVRKID